jgi:hypothetical protein
MLIEIRLLARLLRIPLLRVEGIVALRDDDIEPRLTSSAAARPRMIETMPANVSGAADRPHSAATLPKPKPSLRG